MGGIVVFDAKIGEQRRPPRRPGMFFQKVHKAGEIVRSGPFRVTGQGRRQRGVFSRDRFATDRNERFFEYPHAEEIPGVWDRPECRRRWRRLNLRHGPVHLFPECLERPHRHGTFKRFPVRSCSGVTSFRSRSLKVGGSTRQGIRLASHDGTE